jgi:hypothetical protein
MKDKKPTCKVVARRKGYVLYENGELWTTGKHAFRVGYVDNADNIDYAIDVFEEEMRYLMMKTRSEFALPLDNGI